MPSVVPMYLWRPLLQPMSNTLISHTLLFIIVPFILHRVYNEKYANVFRIKKGRDKWVGSQPCKGRPARSTLKKNKSIIRILMIWYGNISLEFSKCLTCDYLSCFNILHLLGRLGMGIRAVFYGTLQISPENCYGLTHL